MTFRCLWSSLSSSSSSSLYAYTLYRSRMHALDDDCGCSPLGGKSSLIKLKVYHRNLMGRDDFLGQVSVDFQEFKVHDRPKARYCTGTVPGTMPVLYCPHNSVHQSFEIQRRALYSLRFRPLASVIFVSKISSTFNTESMTICTTIYTYYRLLFFSVCTCTALVIIVCFPAMFLRIL